MLNLAPDETAEKAPQQPLPTLTPQEQQVLQHLHEPMHRDELIRQLDLSVTEASQLLMMELAGHIKADNNIYRKNS